MPPAKLKFFLHSLRDIPHVDVIRIGTRVPTTLPQKLYDKELLDILESSEKVWIQTHFNHPREITPEVARVCKSLLERGMPLNNHTVLMKGVNDDLATMRKLMRALAARQDSSLLPVSLRSRHRGRAFPDFDLEGPGDHGRTAWPHVGPGDPDLCAWTLRTAAARFRCCRTTSCRPPMIA